MGWLLSFAKEVVQSAVASVAADELVRLLPSVDHDLEVLRTTLLTTRLRVDKAELWRFKNPHFDQLLMQLKAAFYDAEDLIAEFDYVELQQKIEGGQASQLLSSSLDLVKNLISRPPDKVQRYQRRLDDAVAAVEKAIVDLNFCDEPKLSGMLRRRQTGSSVTEPEVFGRDEERERVIALLLPFGDESRKSNDENYSDGESVSTKRTKRENVSVLPIVGMGGVGKTTLAQLVYNDPRIQNYFEMRIWVCVSNFFDVKRLTKEVVNNAKMRYQTNGKNLSSLQVLLTKMATSKRFLLVLDDVWNEDKMEWQKFYAPIRNGQRGSMILTTTRSLKVADVMGTADSVFLEGLPDDSFWEFFKVCAFGYEKESVNQELESIGKKIATKLKGSLLAAKTVGGLLSEKMEAKHWRTIMNSEMWKLRHGENGILPALQLSYQYLPPHLKRCFSICSFFPKDYEFYEDSLVEFWVAQGFIMPEDDMLLKDVGTRYLHELTSRSFFQQVHQRRKCYLIHDLMHDLALSVSAHEVLMLQNDKNEQRTSPSIVRHLAICASNLELSTLNDLGRYDRLRSILRESFPQFGNSGYLQVILPSTIKTWFSQLRYIRLLDISHCAIQELPENIDNLKLLQYLDISNTHIKRLPESFCRLYNLRVLNLLRCPLQSFPKGFTKLINLWKLHMKDSLFSEVPEIGKLTALQVLPAFEVRQDKGHRITELKDLTQLQRTLCITHLENVESQEEARQAKLCDKEYLDKLVLEWSPSRSTSSARNDFSLHEEVLEGLQPHPNLKKLDIVSYCGEKYPSWLQIQVLPLLSSLQIKYCPDIKDVFRLPHSLKSLVLADVGLEALPKLLDEDSAVEGTSRKSIKSSSLSDLQIVNLSKLTSLQEWLLPLHLPALKSINIVNCNELKSLPIDRFKEFSSLEVLDIQNCPNLTSERKLVLPSSMLSLKIDSCGDLDNSLPSCLQNLTSLASLHLCNCEQIECLPGNVFRNLTALKLLKIENCPKLRSLGGSEALTSLKIVNISDCPGLMESEPLMSVEKVRKEDTSALKLVIDNTALLRLSFFKTLLASTMSLEILGSPETLMFVGGDDEWVQILKPLQSLSFDCCSYLKSLPAWLHGLTSLQELIINDCPEIDLLPSLPTTLEYLYFSNCNSVLTEQLKMHEAVIQQRRSHRFAAGPSNTVI
ncbi:disease resistance protein RGA2-like isoform X1 [Ananas comosus]|uniref:Disease resistance protein RGA2-like isoform X1 n=2 Tax=Ananas comosus TaxID=4615 RepID=A0A6P5EM21_ANACO|nr:disease resistance protein RGA2-like isoform X1 [Ananas comosus]XP_020084650.1 disease resistance protein RGA2-like isoform X2 [Ananas comosus]XP_020084651.1 disease resistance protein RGA2-like isoform X1 [Ananas comosus]CAD1840999.1 unnamed protein product [Ananas comosus var. bracteatus]